MLQGTTVAKYFLYKDSEHKLFTKELYNLNGRTFYGGNARLNKYMQLAQNIYIAMKGTCLMDSVFYAYDNGAVDPVIQKNYSVLLETRDIPVVIDNREEKDFLDRIFKAFYNASIEELIELSHEDSEWEEKHNFYRKEDQKMDSLAHKEEYKMQYADMIKVMERMHI